MTPVAEATAQPGLGRLGEEPLAQLGDHTALVDEGATHGAAALEERSHCVGGGLLELGDDPCPSLRSCRRRRRMARFASR
jgi:hypothetical protein